MQYIIYILSAFLLCNYSNAQNSQSKMTPHIPIQLTKQSITVPTKYVNSFPKNVTINLPSEFTAKVFYAGSQLKKPRFFAWSPDSILHVADLDAASIFGFPDRDKDGIADTIITVAKNVIAHDIKFFNNALYAAQERSVLRLIDTNKDGFYETRSTFIDQIAEGAAQPGGGHTTRTILFDSLHDKMYLSIGSRCNVCRWDTINNTDYLRARIEQWNIDGTGRKTFAYGIRNSVGLMLRDGKVWGANNGSDNQGNEIPPEWIDVIRENGFYGYPFAHSDGIFFPINSNSPNDYKALLPYTIRDSQLVASMKQPAALIQSHSAPMALISAQKNMPEYYRNGVFVALRGSWNRNPATGGKVIFLGFDNEQDTVANLVSDFLSGFMTDSTKSSNWGWARPVGLETDANGNLYIGSDSFNKFILIVSPKSQSSAADDSNKPIHDIISIIAQDDNKVKLTYHLQNIKQCTITLYDIMGNRIKEIVDGTLMPNDEIDFDIAYRGFYMIHIVSQDGINKTLPVIVH